MEWSKPTCRMVFEDSRAREDGGAHLREGWLARGGGRRASRVSQVEDVDNWMRFSTDRESDADYKDGDLRLRVVGNTGGASYRSRPM